MDQRTNKGLEKKRLNTREAAAYMGMPVSTLRWYRYINDGPIYSKPRGRCVYDVADLDRFLQSGLHVPSSARASKELKRHVAL